METARKGKNAAIAVIRWWARVLGVVTAAFFLFMFIGESLEKRHGSSQIEPIAAIGLALMGIYTVAMFLALKWERAGSLLGAAALGSIFVMLFLGLFREAGGGSGRLQYQRCLEPVPSGFLGTRPAVLAVLGTRREGAGRGEVGPLNG